LNIGWVRSVIPNTHLYSTDKCSSIHLKGFGERRMDEKEKRLEWKKMLNFSRSQND